MLIFRLSQSDSHQISLRGTKDRQIRFCKVAVSLVRLVLEDIRPTASEPLLLVATGRRRRLVKFRREGEIIGMNRRRR